MRTGLCYPQTLLLITLDRAQHFLLSVHLNKVFCTALSHTIAATLTTAPSQKFGINSEHCTQLSGCYPFTSSLLHHSHPLVFCMLNTNIFHPISPCSQKKSPDSPLNFENNKFPKKSNPVRRLPHLLSSFQLLYYWQYAFVVICRSDTYFMVWTLCFCWVLSVRHHITRSSR